MKVGDFVYDVRNDGLYVCRVEKLKEVRQIEHAENGKTDLSEHYVLQRSMLSIPRDSEREWVLTRLVAEQALPPELAKKVEDLVAELAEHVFPDA